MMKKMLNLMKPSSLCLICDTKCVKDFATIKYRYENGNIGEVYLCENCAKEYQLDQNELGEEDESI